MSAHAKMLRTEKVEKTSSNQLNLQVSFPTPTLMAQFLEFLRKSKILVKEIELAPSDESVEWRKSGAFKKLIADSNEGAVMLRASRTKHDMTQLELAHALKIEQGHVSEMENGKRPIGKEMAKRLAEVFKTDYRTFL